MIQQAEMYSSKSLSTYPKCQNHILFLHAITSCDTTSAMFRRSKTSVLKLFEKMDLIDSSSVEQFMDIQQEEEEEEEIEEDMSVEVEFEEYESD